MSIVTFYDFELDEGCYKVRILLDALEMDVRRVAVNMLPGNEHTEEPFLLINPFGSLPIFQDGDVMLGDAEAITAYLAHRYDPDRVWLPVEPGAFGKVMHWLVFAARDLNAAVLARRNALFEIPTDVAMVTAATRAALRRMDDHMTAREFEGGAWFVGDGYTLADLAVFPAFALSRDIGIDHDAYPALRRWLRRVRTMPGFRTMPGIPDYH